MKYFLVKYSIRDGENEYDEQIIIATQKTLPVERLFLEAMIGNYGGTKKTWKPYDNDKHTYELPHDYRLVQLESTEEIEDEVRNALLAIGEGFTVTVKN